LTSVDGRTAPVLSSVHQLVDVFPTRCLVRKITMAMTIDDVCHGDGSRSRRLGRGDVLTLVRVTGQRLLQCRDDKGCGVYLPLDQRGLFSAVDAYHTAASVYRLRSLLSEFRLPIIVRLVCGSLPTRDATSVDLRLVGIQTDRVTFVLPLRHAWTSQSVDRRALVAVPSRYASRLTVAAAARDFVGRWVRSDDGLELMRRCGEIAAAWCSSVHVVSGAVAAAAAAAAVSTGVARADDGDDATWSRGPMGSSVDSGLASSTSSPCAAANADDADDDDLEREIDDIYAMIRYGADVAAARRGRARSLDDCLSAGDVLSHKPTLAVYSGRRPSVDVLCVPQTTTARLNRHHPPVASPAYGLQVDNVQLVGVTLRLDAEMDDDDDDDDNVASVDRDSRDMASNSGRHSDPNVSPIYDELGARQRRPRSKSLPVATVVDAERRDAQSHKSLIGTFTRSIVNVLRRIRPRKASHTFEFDAGLNIYSSERYTRRPSYDLVDN